MDVTLLVFHDAPSDEQPPLTRLLAEVRTRLAVEQERRFRAAGVARVIRLPGRATSGASAGTSFGEHLAAAVATERPGGLIVMGSGAGAAPDDRRTRAASWTRLPVTRRAPSPTTGTPPTSSRWRARRS
jgi:hypothetical protein